MLAARWWSSRRMLERACASWSEDRPWPAIPGPLRWGADHSLRPYNRARFPTAQMRATGAIQLILIPSIHPSLVRTFRSKRGRYSFVAVTDFSDRRYYILTNAGKPVFTSSVCSV